MDALEFVYLTARWAVPVAGAVAFMAGRKSGRRWLENAGLAVALVSIGANLYLYLW